MEANLEWLGNPEVFQVNRLDAHSDHKYFKNTEEMKRGESSLVYSLNGAWKFSYAQCPEDRCKEFYKKEYDCSLFDTIQVPGHIQLQGYGQCQYVNTQYPWDGLEELRPPMVPKHNPVGSYVTYFTLPQEMKGQQIILSFQGVETALYLWVNGEFIGYGEDAFTPSEYDITHALTDGENKIAVEVYQRSSASWIEDQDFWRFSGIFRDVLLYARPKTHMKDLKITTDLNDNYEEAVVLGKTTIQGETTGKIIACLKNPAGELIEEMERDTDEENTFLFKVKRPELWSAEKPSLYTIELYVYDKNGALLECVQQPVGIRIFEMVDGVMKLNGERILFRGVNRHEFSETRGRAITKEDMLFDIRFLKQNNINAVRCSHYPNHSYWYELCDEYGVYVIDETNLESHGSWQKMGECEPSWNVPGSLPEWKENVLDRAKSMLQRDKNHPSILIWSCGNEAYAGEDILAMTQYFHKEDSSRLVHYEGVFWNRDFDAISDMESRMYAKPEEIAAYLETKPAKPFISCEYMHAMGNSLGGMHLYMELEDRYEQYQGGFIWDYIDQSLVKVEENGKKKRLYGGDFEDRPTDYCFCTDGIIFADRTPSPKMQEVKELYAGITLTPDETGVTVRNHRLFTDTSDVRLVIEVVKGNTTIFHQETEICVAPLSQEHMQVDFPRLEEKGEYCINASVILKEDTLWGKKGHVMASGQKVLSFGKEEKKAVGGPLTVIHGDVNVGVKGSDFQVLFSKDKGSLTSYKYHGKEYLHQAPALALTRALTDNDKGMGAGFLRGYWMMAQKGQQFVLDTFQVEASEDVVSLAADYALPMAEERIHISYTVTRDGVVEVSIKYPGMKEKPELPLLGMEFAMKNVYDKVTYYGNGPEECYRDRESGARLGVYDTSPEGSLTPYLIPQECGNHTGVRYVEVTDGLGHGLRFDCVQEPLECSVLPYHALELEQAAHHEELPRSSNTWIRILGGQMGVGGDDSWGAPVHEEYTLPSEEPREVRFRFQGK